MKLYNFIVNVTSTESQRTVLRGVINTLESGKLEEIVERNQELEFFQALDRIFELEYGKVLLAVSTRHQLEEMVGRGLPYLADYREEVSSCTNGSGCEGIRKVVDTLGKIKLEVWLNSFLSESKDGLRELSLNPPHMLGAERTLLPSSFLPFCAYQSEVLGEVGTGLPVTPCTLATPTLLAGQICYSFNAL